MLPISAATREDQPSLKHKCARAVSPWVFGAQFRPCSAIATLNATRPESAFCSGEVTGGPHADVAHRFVSRSAAVPESVILRRTRAEVERFGVSIIVQPWHSHTPRGHRAGP